MTKIIWLLLALSFNSYAQFYTGANKAVNLYNIEMFKNKVEQISGSLDPSSSAVNAPKGSIYLSTNGNVYVKQDAGSSINWSPLSGAGSGVTSVTGTTNQITTSATTGSITLSLPSNVSIVGNLSTSAINLSGLSASRPVKTDASKNLTTASIDLASADVTGKLPQANGGLGSVTPSAVNYVLKSDGTNWVSGPQSGGGGGITGPVATSTGAIVVWDATDGTAIKQLNTGNHRDVVGVSGSAIQMVPMPRLYGTLTITAATDCIWTTTQTTATNSFAADADCSNSFVYTGGLSTTGSQIPKALMNNAPVGNYYVVVEGGLIVGASGNGYGVSLREISGVEFAKKKMDNGVTQTQSMHMTGILTVNSQGDTAIDVRMWTEGGTVNYRNNVAGQEEVKIMVFYYPPL